MNMDREFEYKIAVKLEQIEMKINNIQNRIYELLELTYKAEKSDNGTGTEDAGH